MIPCLHAVATQAQYVGYAQSGRAQHIALNSETVAVATGDLHDSRITVALQKRAYGDAGHVAVRPRSIRGVDGIHISVENPRAGIHLFRIGGIRRREFGRYGKLTAGQQFFEGADVTHVTPS